MWLWEACNEQSFHWLLLGCVFEHKDPTDKKKRVGRCASCLLGKGPELRVEGSEAVSLLSFLD